MFCFPCLFILIKIIDMRVSINLTLHFSFRPDMHWNQPGEKKLTGGQNWQNKTMSTTQWGPAPMAPQPMPVPHVVRAKSGPSVSYCTATEKVSLKTVYYNLGGLRSVSFTINWRRVVVLYCSVVNTRPTSTKCELRFAKTQVVLNWKWSSLKRLNF